MLVGSLPSFWLRSWSLASTGRRFIGDCLPSPTLRDLQRSQPSWSKPGPVGGLPWATITLDSRLATGVPVAQIDLGVAGYGYSWPGNGSDDRQLSDNSPGTPANDLARWNPTETEWTPAFPDDTVVWWSDSRSLSERRALVLSGTVYGLAVWELSLTDPLSAGPGTPGRSAYRCSVHNVSRHSQPAQRRISTRVLEVIAKCSIPVSGLILAAAF